MEGIGRQAAWPVFVGGSEHGEEQGSRGKKLLLGARDTADSPVNCKFTTKKDIVNELFLFYDSGICCGPCPAQSRQSMSRTC